MKKEERSRLFEFFASQSEKLERYVHAKAQRINNMDAEDIVREVMVSLLSRDDRSGPIENIAAYSYRSIRNKIADYHRQNAELVSLDASNDSNEDLPLLQLLVDETQNVSSDVERQEMLMELSQCMDRLDGKQRAVLIATEFQGKTFAELAEEWEEPIGTLLSRKCRAIKTLRSMMNEQTD